MTGMRPEIVAPRRGFEMTIKELITMGFRQEATWERDELGHALYKGKLPDKPGIYLFVVNAEVQYVGSTLVNLRDRMDKYKKRQANGDLSRPVHRELAAALAKNIPVEIYFRHISADERTPWDSLSVSVLLGAEAALIATLQPIWNRRGRALLLDSTSVNDDTEVT
jgi:hypothetical protein